MFQAKTEPIRHKAIKDPNKIANAQNCQCGGSWFYFLSIIFLSMLITVSNWMWINGAVWYKFNHKFLMSMHFGVQWLVMILYFI